MKIFVQICLFIIVSFVAAPFVYSCSCFKIDNKDEIGITDVIFTGIVIEITEDKTYASPQIENEQPKKENRAVFPVAIEGHNKNQRFLIKFKVDKKFKGIDADEITLVRYEWKVLGCSGISFIKGKKYLIYASKIDNELADGGMCSRTQNFDKKSDDYQELRNLKKKSGSNKIWQSKIL